MVRLKEKTGAIAPAVSNHFNSSMVRLKVSVPRYNSKGDYLFQFQYGAIERSESERLERLEKIFQFQYGAIESRIVEGYFASFNNFNSSMVRLKAI